MQNFMITLLICSVAMSVLALLYMAAMPLLAKRYSEKGRYYAWLIIVVGLIIPFRPQWSNALFSVELPSSAPPPIVQVSGEATPIFPPFTLPALPTLPNLPPVEYATAYETAINIPWWHIGLSVWLAGAILFIAFHGIKHYRFMKVARRWSENITDEKILSLIESLKSEMGIKRRIPVYVCPFAGSPMIIGLIKPQMLLSTIELAQDELCFIIKHELVHYKRKDLLYKCLVLAARALHWFNPAVHLMAKAVNVLCETSCDAEVLRSADTQTRLSYGETIIGVAQYQSKLCTALSTNFYGGKRGMKTRISSIMDTGKKKTGAVIAMLVLILSLGSGVAFAATSPPNAESSISDPTIWEDEQGIQHRYLHPQTRQPITPEERAGLRSAIIQPVPRHRPVMEFMPQGATDTQIWLVEQFAGLYRPAERIEDLTYIGYELAIDLVFSHAVTQFDEFFGRGAAYATMASPEFRTLFALLGPDMFYGIVAVENFADWMESIFGESIMRELREIPMRPDHTTISRLQRFEQYLEVFVDEVRQLVLTDDFFLDLTLPPEVTLQRGFQIIGGNIHDRNGNLFIALDENGLMACGTRIAYNFRISEPVSNER